MRSFSFSVRIVLLVMLFYNVTLRVWAQSAPSEVQSAQEKYAIDQLRAIVGGIKKCPDRRIMNNNGSGANIYAPMNVVWDVKDQDSFRSKKMAFIEFVQHSSYIQQQLELCKKRDSACKRRNEITSDMNSIMTTINSPDNFRYEFEFGPSGLEFNRALMKHEADDATHWAAARLGKECEAQAVLTVIN